MLSKEEKLKYGQILRQQMREKEERKKMEEVSKRNNSNVPKSQSDRILMVDPSVLAPKEILQQKLEAQDYNPFGRQGGGAPNRKLPNQQNNHSALVVPTAEDQSFQRNYPPEYNENGLGYPGNDPRYGVQPGQYERRGESVQKAYNNYEPSFQKSGSDYPLKPTYPGEYGNVESPQQQRKFVDPRMLPPQRQQQQQQQQQYQPAIDPQTYENGARGQQYDSRQYGEYNGQRQYQGNPSGVQQLGPNYPQQYRQQYNPPRQEYPVRQQYVGVRPGVQVRGPMPVQGRERVKTMQNDEMQEMYKRGGRNLLKLQNETVNEHMVKQKQKEEMKNFLRQQMEEADRKKQEEKERLKREELEEEERNKRYIEMQNMKLREEEQKKENQKQKIVDENLRNIAKRREMEQEAKDKLERERLQQERRMINEVEHARERDRPKQEFRQTRVERPSRDQTPSSLSSSTSGENATGKNFNTQISRQFFRKEKQREGERNQNDKKLQLFTNEIQKMRDEINNQGEVFKKEIEKIKKEAESAHDEKRKAELQIERLRLELERKNKESELKLLEALKRNDPQPYNPPYYPPPPSKYQPHLQQYQQEYDSLSQLQQQDLTEDRRPYGIPSRPPPPPPQQQEYKPMAKAKKVYEHPPQYEQRQGDSRQKLRDYQWQPEFKLQQSNIGTLQANSKKIPVNMPQHGPKLTMSNIENFGKEEFMFGKSRVQPKPEEERKFSRNSKRSNMDELDKLVDKNENKWEMSTVKDDITHQIEELLKKKDSVGQMSQAGRQILSRGAIPYDGPALNTLNSNKASLVSNGGTFDVDRINDKNEARLRELRALGVQTINTTNDDDLNRLNALLKNYH